MIYVLLVQLFVHFARLDFCPFSLPLGVRAWLRLVIVELTGLLYTCSQKDGVQEIQQSNNRKSQDSVVRVQAILIVSN